ncbi:4'-phosphopantetheinyl transferase family protein [Thermoactinomyces mirandus]|uniref:4'-phosphopantetheinyl transferase superfamily protein n=1 Tax=Thermoactinomyces mirandus TaxID=2756294 RepID=A0A7W2AQX4_9BACL|nr:4'-phosphopantetheinyl transferase superfamily protein [Thermoactinomyces mirandus]MBA4600980.1 4'-phosphopantetheinyl transferase superfamily protein [Thermoactinomyces mirandus]
MKDQLVPGCVYVWFTPLSAARPELETILDETETERYRSYRKREDQKRALLSFGLLRLVLSRFLEKPPEEIRISRECPHCHKPHGKPRVLDGDSIEVNISHSGNWVLTALTLNQPIGIDIEQRSFSHHWQELIGHVLSAKEHKEWEKLSDREKAIAFFQYWTQKEAILKATGDGLTVPMSHLSVSRKTGIPRLTDWHGHEERVSQIHCYPLEIDSSHEACLAVMGQCWQICLRDGKLVIEAWLEKRGEKFVH